MATSQNLRFAATVPADAEFDHPPGATLMRRLSAELSTAGWRTNEVDNWRDSGWSVLCSRGPGQLQLALSQIQNGEWMLQVVPHRVPGFFGGLVGSKPSATPAEVYELALAVHRALSVAGFLDSPRWRRDGFPDDEHSTPEPNAV
jgi:hypothetical protein